MHSRATVQSTGGFLVGAIREDGDTRVVQGIAAQRIGRGIWIIEGGVERTGLVAIEQRLLTVRVLVLLLVAVRLWLKEKVFVSVWFPFFSGLFVSLFSSNPLLSSPSSLGLGVSTNLGLARVRTVRAAFARLG